MTARCLMTATTGTERRQWGTATNPTEMDRWHARSRRRLCRRGEATRCWRCRSTWWPRRREGVGNYEEVQVRGTVAKKKRAVGLISTCQNIANRNATVGYGWRGRQFHYDEGDGNVIEMGRVKKQGHSMMRRVSSSATGVTGRISELGEYGRR